MAINRTNFNLLVDDDGTNLIGTVWDKAHIKDVILDPVDAALIDPGSLAGYTVVNSTQTGTVSGWNPGHVGKGPTLVLWSGVAPLTVTSLAPGVSGQLVTVKNTSPYAAAFVHGGAGSAIFINFAASAPTSIAAQTGVVTYQYDGLSAVWRLMTHEQGAWITPPFNAANFTAVGGTWTVDAADVVVYSYHLTGRRMALAVALTATTLTAGNELGVKIPDGFLGGYAGFVFQLGYIVDNGVKRIAELYTAPGGTTLQARPLELGALAASTNNTQLQAVVTLAVQ